MEKSEPQKHHYQQQSSNESDESEEEEEEEENSFNFDSQSSTSSSDASLQNPNSSRLNNFRIEPIIPKTRRKTSVSLPSDEPRSGIVRVWTEEDEVVILKGMLNFAKMGKSPYKNAAGFLGCYGETLSFEPSVEQLKYKMRRLKTRFDLISRRAVGDDGEDPVLEKPHDLRVYGLGKKIWGRKDGKFAEIVGIDVRKNKKKKKKKKKKDFGDESDELRQKKKLRFKVNGASWCVFPWLDDLMKLDVRDCSKEEEEIAGLIEKKRKLEVSDVKAYLKWVDFVRERALKVLEVIESADSLEYFKR